MINFIVMMPAVTRIKDELTGLAHRIADDHLTLASGGNISARTDGHIYIKAQGVSLETARPSDFVKLSIERSSVSTMKRRPSKEYRLHISCYKRRPDIRAVIHVHPITITTLSSLGVLSRPITIEYALYIGARIASIDFIRPGSKQLAEAVAQKIIKHDAVIIKRHGLITVGRTMQEAYLKTLIIEREAKAHLICRLFKRCPPYLSREQMHDLGVV